MTEVQSLSELCCRTLVTHVFYDEIEGCEDHLDNKSWIQLQKFINMWNIENIHLATNIIKFVEDNKIKNFCVFVHITM